MRKQTYLIEAIIHGEVARSRHATGKRKAKQLFGDMLRAMTCFPGGYVRVRDESNNPVDLYATKPQESQ